MQDGYLWQQFFSLLLLRYHGKQLQGETAQDALILVNATVNHFAAPGKSKL
jgi:hypothetical protein